MQFCKLHNTRLSTSYLKECAKSDDWLQFIIQTQLYSYKPDEVSCLCMGLNEDEIFKNAHCEAVKNIYIYN